MVIICQQGSQLQAEFGGIKINFSHQSPDVLAIGGDLSSTELFWDKN